jgi:hypothetical protein
MPLERMAHVTAQAQMALERAHTTRIAEIIAATGWPGILTCD